MHTRDQHGLLKAIIDSPEDNLARLAYADWLEEQNDAPQANFIRNHIALYNDEHADRPTLSEDERKELKASCKVYLKEHPVTVPGLDAKTLKKYKITFERGFPSHIEAQGVNFQKTGGQLLTALPTVHSLCLRDMLQVHWNKVMEIPALRKIHALKLRYARDTDIESIANCPHLSNLKELDLSYPSNITHESIRILGSSALSQQLQSLDVTGTDMQRFWPPLQWGTNWPQLKELKIGKSRVGCEDFVQLIDMMAQGNMPMLKKLDFHGNNLNLYNLTLQKATKEQLQSSPVLDNVNLQDCSLRDVWLEQLSQLPCLQQAKEINFSYNYLDKNAIPALARLLSARSESLDLTNNVYFATSGAHGLANTPQCQHLRHLKIGHCNIRNDGFAALANSQHFNQLLRLDASFNTLTNDVLNCLDTAMGFRSLETLTANGNRFNRTALPVLAACTGLPALQRLKLDYRLDKLARNHFSKPVSSHETPSPQVEVQSLASRYRAGELRIA